LTTTATLSVKLSHERESGSTKPECLALNDRNTHDIFEIADSLLTDKDDLVQKGYGWLLKDAAIQHQKEVFEYVMKNRSIMPRTALRYAIERLPADLKKQAMEK